MAASRCIQRGAEHQTWCGRADTGDAFSDVASAIARAEGDVCLKCAFAVARSLRGPDPTIEFEMDEALFRAASIPAEQLILQNPTSERVFMVAATLLQAAAACWVRYHQGEGPAAYLPLDGERFQRLAGAMFELATQGRN